MATYSPVEAWRPYKGGEELRQASATMARPKLPSEVAQAAEARLGSEAEAGSDAAEEALQVAPEAHEDTVETPEADTQGDPESRALTAEAQRYAAAVQRNPQDFDAFYGHGLVLQELATRCAGPDHLRLLQEACQKYEAAWRLRQESHAALYNWGVALSDLARAMKQDGKQTARAHLLLAAEKYALSLQINPANPQALNNWGLVLQELAGLGPAGERGRLVGHATAKFRRAIRLRPDFDRACYNCGTVFYAHAAALQAAAAARAAGQDNPDEAADERERAGVEVRRAYGQAAQYITLSYALQPTKAVYAKSLQVVVQMLPLPYLRVGYLLAVVPETVGTVEERWQRCWFVLDHASLRTAEYPHKDAAGLQILPYALKLTDIASARSIADPSLPKGFGIWVSLHTRAEGYFLVADREDDAEAWVDALHMASHLAQEKRIQPLAKALTVLERQRFAEAPEQQIQ